MFSKTLIVLVAVTLTAGARLGFPPQQAFQVRFDDDSDDQKSNFNQVGRQSAQPQNPFQVRHNDDGDDDDFKKQVVRISAPQQATQARPQFQVRHNDDSDDDNKFRSQARPSFPPQQASFPPQQQFQVRQNEDLEEDDDNVVIHFQPQQPQQQFSAPAQQPQQQFSAPVQQPQQPRFTVTPQQQFAGAVPLPQQQFSAPVQQPQQPRFTVTGQSQQGFQAQQFRVDDDSDDDHSWEEGSDKSQKAPEQRIQTITLPVSQPISQTVSQPRFQPSTQQKFNAYPVQDSRATLSEDPAKYEFEYAVRDSLSGNDFGHSETRDGDNTRGEYFVRLADGRLQRVAYSVLGDSGFVALVTYEGEVRLEAPTRSGSPYPGRRN